MSSRKIDDDIPDWAETVKKPHRTIELSSCFKVRTCVNYSPFFPEDSFLKSFFSISTFLCNISFCIRYL